VEPAPQRRTRKLAAEHRELARARIRRAAGEVIARRGFNATIEEIAEASGVSPRTVFRHFPSHDLLIAEGVKEMFSGLARPIEGLPDRAEDFDGWLHGLSLEIHTRLDRILGRAFWDIRAPEPHNPDTLAQTLESQRLRLRWITSTAAKAWRSAGGTGEPPRHVVELFALFLSAFTTQALATEFGNTPEQTAAVTASTLKVVLVQAVQDQRRAPSM
jgi:AcrR family transcriptional regulator